MLLASTRWKPAAEPLSSTLVVYLIQHFGQHRYHLVCLLPADIERPYEAPQVRAWRVQQQSRRFHIAYQFGDLRTGSAPSFNVCSKPLCRLGYCLAFTRLAFYTVMFTEHFSAALHLLS